MEDTTSLVVSIPRELHARIQAAAAERGESVSAFVRDALVEYLEQLEDAEVGPRAQAAYEEWKRDPSTACPWEDFKADLVRGGLVDK